MAESMAAIISSAVRSFIGTLSQAVPTLVVEDHQTVMPCFMGDRDACSKRIVIDAGDLGKRQIQREQVAQPGPIAPMNHVGRDRMTTFGGSHKRYKGGMVAMLRDER